MNSTSHNLINQFVPGAVQDFKSQFLAEFTRQPLAGEIEVWNEEFKDRQSELEGCCSRTGFEKTTRVQRVLNLDGETYQALLRVCFEPDIQQPLPNTSSNSTSDNHVNHVQASGAQLMTITFSSSSPTKSYLKPKAAGKARMGQQKRPEAGVGSSKRTILSKKPPRAEEIDHLKREVEMSKKSADESSERLKQVEEQLSKAKKKLEGLNQECDGFRRDNQDLHWSKDELTEKLEAKNRELEQREVEWREVEKTQKERWEESEKEKKLMRKERKRLEDRLKLSTEQLEGSNGSRDAARAELENYKAEIETFKADLEKERLASAANRQEVEQGSQAVREAVAVYKADTIRWNAEKKTLEDNIKEREDAILRLQAALKFKDDELDRVRKSSASLEGEMEIISRSYADLQEKTSVDDTTLTAIKDQVESQTAELERAKSEISTAENKAEQSKENLRKLQAERDRQRVKLEKLSGKARTLGTDLAGVRNRFVNGNSPVAEVLETCDSLGGRILGMSYALEDLATSSKAARSEPVRTVPRSTRKSASTSKLASPPSARGTDPLELRPIPPLASISRAGKPSAPQSTRESTPPPSARRTDPLQLQPTPPPISTSQSTTAQLPSSSGQPSTAQPPSSKPTKPSSSDLVSKPSDTRKRPTLASQVAGSSTSSSRPWRPRADVDLSLDESMDATEVKRPSQKPACSKQKLNQTIISESSSSEGEDESLRVGNGNSSKTISSRDKLIKGDRRKQLIPPSLGPQQKGDDDPKPRSKVNPQLDTSAASSTTPASSTSSAGNKTFTSPRKRLRMEEVVVKKVSRTQPDSTASTTGEVIYTSPRKRPRMEGASGAQSGREGGIRFRHYVPLSSPARRLTGRLQHYERDGG
ncbi:hypothetical protein AAF712_003809 [Marasmius tenuissimus]|uniref:Uncharacterized protein n=1 Tax=Marasmius tenuissimus TaxID=585030 RepID=A0ABR3A7Z4_9AGAR